MLLALPILAAVTVIALLAIAAWGLLQVRLQTVVRHRGPVRRVAVPLLLLGLLLPTVAQASPAPGPMRWRSSAVAWGEGEISSGRASGERPSFGENRTSGFRLFLQVDPSGYADSPNLYAGFANDPVNNRDPTGAVVPCKLPPGGKALFFRGTDGKTLSNYPEGCGLPDPTMGPAPPKVSEGDYVRVLVEQKAQDCKDAGTGYLGYRRCKLGWGTEEEKRFVRNIDNLANDVAMVVGLGMRPAPPQGETVFRVQGGVPPNASKVRIQLGETGRVTIAGDDMLYINLGQEQRAADFLAKRGDTAELFQGQISPEFAAKLRAEAVPQRIGRLHPGRPQVVDSTKAVDQYGVPKEWFQEFIDSLVPGTVKNGKP